MFYHVLTSYHVVQWICVFLCFFHYCQYKFVFCNQLFYFNPYEPAELYKRHYYMRKINSLLYLFILYSSWLRIKVLVILAVHLLFPPVQKRLDYPVYKSTKKFKSLQSPNIQYWFNVNLKKFIKFFSSDTLFLHAFR